MLTSTVTNLLPAKELSRSVLTNQLRHYYASVAGASDLSLAREEYFANFTDGSRDILKGYTETVENINAMSVDGIVAYQNRALAEMNANSVKYLKGLWTFGKNMLLILGSQLVIRAAEYIWENLPFTERHKQKIAEYAEQAMQTLDEGLSKASEDLSAVENIEDEFKKLSAGVSRTGENLSLTNSQYDKYVSYVEELIKINPQLVEGINAQGKAFINNATAIEDTIQLLKEQRRETYASFFNGKDNKSVLEDIVNERKSIDSSINKIKGIRNRPGIQTNLLGNNRGEGLYPDFSSMVMLARHNNDKKAYKELEAISKEYGLSYIEIAQDTEAAARRIDAGYNELYKIAEKYNNDRFIQALARNREYLTQLDQQYDQQESVDKKFDDYVDRYARSQETYWNLNTQQQKLIDAFIQDYDFSDKIFEDGIDYETAERQMTIDIDDYLEFLSGMSDKISEKMMEISSIDKSKISYNNYKSQVNNLIEQILNDPTYNSDLLPEAKLRVQLGVDFETNNGEIENEYENMIDNLVNRFERKSLPTAPSSEIKKFRKEVEENLRELTPDEILKLYNAEDLNIFSSWDRAKSYVDVQQGFDIETYKESIEEVTKDLKTLGEAYKKIKEGKLSPEISGSTEEVMGLVSEFDELNEYVDYGAKNFGNLEIGLRKVIKARPDKLIISFKQLGNLAAKDAKEVDKVVEALRNLVDDALGDDVSFIVGAGLTESDYLQYVTRDYDKIIKSLEKQKEATEEVNDALEEQKEKLDEIVDNYETAGNTVIKTIEDKIDDVTKFYDEQIDRLKEENDELERNIDLQEKRDNLANARKTKLHVYSETQGWYYTTDKSAIKKAEDELAKSEREVKIADLEKERDAEIKLWEEYKEAWQDAMDSYTKAHDEAITEGILGVEWREKVIERDEDMLDTYQQNYSSFKDQLDDSIDEQIKKNKEYVNSIDKKIKEYQKDIDEMKDWVEEQESQKLRYFELIDDIKITENSTWEQRLANFKEFKENWKQIAKEIAEINDEPEVPENPKLKLTYQGNNLSIANSSMFNQEYNSKEEALQARTRIATQIRNERLASIPKNMQTSALLKRLLDEILDDIKLDTVGSYAHGGVIDYTGLANVHGSSSNAEVALSSSQARTVYDFIASGALSKATAAMSSAYNMLINALPKPSLNGINLPMSGAIIPNSDRVTSANKSVNNELTISFPNATINAKDYDTFKKYMDTYTNDLMLKMQVGL